MGRRRDKLLGSRRRQVLQLEDTDGRDSFLTQYGYSSRYGDEEEEDMNDGAPMTQRYGYLDEENMDCDSDEKYQDTEEDTKHGTDVIANGAGHSEVPQEGKKIDSELANFMAEIEAISSVALPPPDEEGGEQEAGVSLKTPPDKENEAEPTAKPEEKPKPKDDTIVFLEEPVTKWQQCLDENTECYYYWHVDTNEVTWEIPPDFTQYLLEFKAFEEKIVTLEKAGKTVKIAGVPEGSAGNDQAQSENSEGHVYGPFLPEKPNIDSNKSKTSDTKGDNSSVSVVAAKGKLLSADYYDSDDGSEEEGDKATKQAVEPEDEDLDFDIDDIDRELELALERKQAEAKSSSKSSDSKKSEASPKSTPAEEEEPVATVSSSTPAAPAPEPDEVKIEPEEIPMQVDQVSSDNVVPESAGNSGEDLKDCSKSVLDSTKMSEFSANNDEKDKNFKKLIEVKHKRSSSERREKKSEDRHERKSSREESSREERRSSKDDRSKGKSERKEERKSEHKEKRKKDERKEEKKSHRHKHSKGEGKDKSKYSADHKRSYSDQDEENSDDHRSHRKRSKHKHKDKDKDWSSTIVIKDDPELPLSTPTDILPPKPEILSIQETIEDVSETVLGKLQFLEVVKEGLSGLQTLLISLETRILDWQAGGLSAQYLLQKLQDASDQLLKYEDSAAPPGWSTHWDRNYRRYFYTNTVTGNSQWDYPDLDAETSAPVPAPEAASNRVPQEGEAATIKEEKTHGNQEKNGESKTEDTEKIIKDKPETRVDDLKPVVHPGEPPPPGTEAEVGEIVEGPVGPESYEVSPAHSIDMEEMEDVEEDDKANSEASDSKVAAVISRPPQLLGSEAGDSSPTSLAPSVPASNIPLSFLPDEPPKLPLHQTEVSAGSSLPEVTPSADGDKASTDPSSSLHKEKEKEKKKKKDKSISSHSLSLKKKKVSSLVQKWQQVQQEVEREEQTTKERESYLNRYSP